MSLFDQPRLRFATLPTPLQFAANLTRELGGPRVYLKRDDLTGLALGGNKTRKLEYLVADAVALGATCLITEGAAQSNHARQTAAAARLAGLECALVLQAPDAAPAVQGNLLLDHLLGAEVLINHPDAPVTLDQAAADVADRGGVPYAIPAGGSTGVGALGYVAAMLELAGQLWEQGVAPRALYFADGSGGTHAGIALGKALYGLHFPAIGVRVSGDAALGRERALRVVEQAADRLGIANPLAESDLRCDDRQVGQGYGIPTAGCLEAIALLARTEAILLDPVYTGKAFAGLVADIRAGAYSPAESVVFLHTGGSPALFAQVDTLRSELGF